MNHFSAVYLARNHRMGITCLSLFLGLAISSAGFAAAPVGSGGNIPHFQLNWADEFDQGYADSQSGHSYTDPVAPNPAVWTNPPVTRYNNNETQEYRQRQENVYVSNGSLVLQLLASGTTVSGRVCTSGMVVSRVKSASYPDAHDFTKNGRIEWCAKIPNGASMWPALWMEGSTGTWPACGEIDVLEYFGAQTDFTRTFGYGSSAALHWSDASNVHVGANLVLPMRDPSTDWHIWAVERDAKEMLFFFDDILIQRWDITDPAMSEFSDRTSFAEMNLAYVGTVATPDNGTKMYVDYVREYTFKPGVRRHYPPLVTMGGQGGRRSRPSLASHCASRPTPPATGSRDAASLGNGSRSAAPMPRPSPTRRRSRLQSRLTTLEATRCAASPTTASMPDGRPET